MAIEQDLKKLRILREEAIRNNDDNKEFVSAKKCDQFFLGNKSANDEVALYLKDVYMVVSRINEELSNGEVSGYNKLEIYNGDLEEIGESDENGKLNFDREILDRELSEEIIDLLNIIKKQKENGLDLSIAGMNDNREFDIYVQFIEDKVLTITEKQKQIEERELRNGMVSKKNKNEIGQRVLDNKEDEEVNEEAKKEELQKVEIANDLGIAPEEIYQTTEIKEGLFYENNGIPGERGAFALRTRSGEIMIVNKNQEGNFERTAGFDKITNETGRTPIMTNDDNNMRESNFYGAVYSGRYPDMRYVCEIGKYGEIKLVEQIKITQNESDQTIEDYEMWAPGREVGTTNTDLEDVDRKGIGQDNDLRSMYNRSTNENLRMNREAAKIRNKGAAGFTPEEITDVNVFNKAAAIMKEVEDELRSRNIELIDEDKKVLYKYFMEKDISLNDEDRMKLCDFIQNKLEKGEHLFQLPEDISRLKTNAQVKQDQLYKDISKMDLDMVVEPVIDGVCDAVEEIDNEIEERTLESDALERMRKRHGGN